MSQDQAILLLFKVFLIADVVSIAAFTAIYTRYAHWWRNPVGRTIVIMELLLLAAICPSILSLFLHFNRLTSHIAAWFDLATFAAMAVVMFWRCVVWRRIYHSGTLPRDGGAP